MGRSVLVDACFIVALLADGEQDHDWAVMQVRHHPHPWLTGEAVLSEAFFLLERRGGVPQLIELLRRGIVKVAFSLEEEIPAISALLDKYRNVPMSLADGCLVRMTEVVTDPVLLTTDSDFRIYRRLSRLVIPCVLPSERGR